MKVGDFIKREDAVRAVKAYWKKRLDTLPLGRDNTQNIDNILEYNKVLCGFINAIPSVKTGEIKYYDEDEKVWKIGKVIVDKETDHE